MMALIVNLINMTSVSSRFVPIETADITWREGLPFSQLFTDIYFSKENGLAETQHVFVEGNELLTRWQNLTQEIFTIAETGFGTGLNFLLTWSLWLKYAPKSARLYFISCEKFPLTKTQLAHCLSLWPELQEQANALIENYPVLTPGFHYLQFEQGRINLILMLDEAVASFHQLLVCGDNTLESQLRKNYIDAWFLDGFSPAKNQAMWSAELMQIIGLLSKPGTTLATFSAAAAVKNNLQLAGFIVEKKKGFGAKRDMTVARFQQSISCNKKGRTTPWHVDTLKTCNTKQAIVLGAGLAGCYTAHALAKRGWQVSLLDQHNTVGLGASGNRQAVLYPKLSAYRSPLTVFMLTAFLFANREYRRLLAKHPLGELAGILQFAFNEKEQATQENLAEWLSCYPELGQLIDAQQASVLAGIELTAGGMLIPQSGWLDSQALCEVLHQTPGISWFPNTAITELQFNEGRWCAGEHAAEVLILATGSQTKQFEQVSYLPLKVIRGQMTHIASNEASSQLKIPLCSAGHVLPEYRTMHALGASYHLGSSDKTNCMADDLSNLSKLTKMPTKIAWSQDIQASWAEIRVATTDYLPLVGPAPDRDIFLSQYASLATNSKRWLPAAGAFLPGLFLCTGFGSRGLTTIPLCAEWLAAQINQEPSIIPRSMIQSLSPARFLLRALVKP